MRNTMNKLHDDLFDLEHEILVLKKPGQTQNEESIERQRKFDTRAQAIETLKNLRIRGKQHAKAEAPAPRKAKKR